MKKITLVTVIFLMMSLPVNAKSDATDALIAMRKKFDIELNHDYNVLRKYVFLTEKTVGSQGEEAQQIFIEMVMNQAKAKKATLNQVMNSRYFPVLKQKVVDLSEDKHRKYVNMIDNALEGSNFAKLMTDNVYAKKAGSRKAARNGFEVGNEFFYVDKGHVPFFSELDMFLRQLSGENINKPVIRKVIKKDEKKDDKKDVKKDDNKEVKKIEENEAKPPVDAVTPVVPVPAPAPEVKPVPVVPDVVQPTPAPVAPAPKPAPVQEEKAPWWKQLIDDVRIFIDKRT